MNNLIDILQENSNKESSQIIISTHSSFVLNKLGLENLILLSNKKSSKITNLSSDTEKYFKAISGYDTCGECSTIVQTTNRTTPKSRNR